MISAKHAPKLFALLMAFLMSGLMSFVVTTFNVGLVSNLVFLWLKAWSFAFCIAFPCILGLAPLVQKLVAKMVSP